MKTFILFVLILISIKTKANDETKFILEFYYGNSNNISKLFNLKDDETICCLFEFRFVRKNELNEVYALVKDKNTNIILGTLYGVPTKEFIMNLIQTKKL